jgi:hypothetical protein
MFNQSGRRIATVGNAEYAAFYENPRPVIDLQISKTVWKSLDVRISARDILARNLVYYQDLDQDGKLDRSKDNVMWDFKLGSTYGITAAYRF